MRGVRGKPLPDLRMPSNGPRPDPLPPARMAAAHAARPHRPLAPTFTPMTVTGEDLATWLITAGLALVVIGFILGDLYGEHHDHK